MKKIWRKKVKIMESIEIVSGDDIELIEYLDKYKDPNGEIYTIEEFIDICDDGGFIDDDGVGEMLLEDGAVIGDIHPSQTQDPNWEIPDGVINVNWFHSSHLRTSELNFN